ncbi:pseudouridine synthase [Powellomyces hirtus]|nr:pseudouridine synthase [Powellomyces hirtus]
MQPEFSNSTDVIPPNLTPQSASLPSAETSSKKRNEVLPASPPERPAKRVKGGENYVDTAHKEKLKQRGRRDFKLESEQLLADVHYYFEKGLRKVEPYEFTYKTYVKGRWIGRPLIETFTKEFQDKTPEYYRQAIICGKITINDKMVAVDYKPRGGDIMAHSIHRHEPPVTADPLDLVYSDENLLVVNKPSSIPIHPTGRYHHNTMLHILRSREFGFIDLHPVNRLDRLTSGLCLVARNKATSTSMMTEFQERTVQKTYLCRVRGEFPEEQIVCEEPILTVSQKLGVNVVSPEGKECKTVFDRLSYNGLTSVVQCKPYSGRTHQIRVHLQYLGHPIANDPIYGCDIWGPDMGKGGVGKAEIAKVLEELTPYAYPQDPKADPADETKAAEPGKPADQPNEVGEASSAVNPARNLACGECTVRRMDPIPEQLQIWLHSWKYELKQGHYETSMPTWADAKFRGDQALVERFWKHGGKWDGVNAGMIVD